MRHTKNKIVRQTAILGGFLALPAGQAACPRHCAACQMPKRCVEICRLGTSRQTEATFRPFQPYARFFVGPLPMYFSSQSKYS